MDITVIIGIGIVASILAVVLAQYRAEYKLMLSLAAGIVMLFIIIVNMQPIIAQLDTMFSYSQMPKSYVGILIKALGICFLSQLAGDVCKDAGESSIAAKIELGGKIAVLILSLPLFSELLSIASALIKL